MADDPGAQALISAHYRALVAAHGATPAGTQMSAEGQRFRFDKLMEVADLDGLEVLDLGCGTGAFYPRLAARFPGVRYTGVDILPEMVGVARQSWPAARFMAADILGDDGPADASADVVLASGIFNNARADSELFMRRMLSRAFALCRRALAFNFISTQVTRRDPGMDYHDPADVLRFCLDEMSPRVSLHHHYERCDVAVFVTR
jgi:SAM-dependent methyltransferase